MIKRSYRDDPEYLDKLIKYHRDNNQPPKGDTMSKDPSKHTPLPWEINPMGNRIHKKYGHPGTIVNIPKGTEARANAALIIKAVNNHAALLGACEEALYQLNRDHSVFISGNKLITRNMLQDAIRQAETEG